MKNIFKIKLLIALIFITTISCNKTKQNSNRLSGGTWKVTSIVIDEIPYDILPSFTFNDCNIYDEICTGAISTDGAGTAEFAWQVRDKGTTFELSDQTVIVNETNEEAVSLSSSFSGIYHIDNLSKNSMQMNSTSTVRYPGKSVIITLEKM